MTTGEAAEFADANPVKNGEMVYEDAYYTVYLYDSADEFIGYAEQR